jgi:hypothetical protein
MYHVTERLIQVAEKIYDKHRRRIDRPDYQDLNPLKTEADLPIGSNYVQPGELRKLKKTVVTGKNRVGDLYR